MITFRRTVCRYTTNDCTNDSVKERTAIITSAYRIIITISKIVLIGETIAIGINRCKRSAVGVNKPLHRRVIIPASEIVQSRLRVVIVSTVANGVNARNAAALGDYVAPGIIGIAAIALAPLGAAGVLDLRPLEKKISGLESAKSTVYSHSYGLHNIFFRFQPEL